MKSGAGVTEFRSLVRSRPAGRNLSSSPPLGKNSAPCMIKPLGSDSTEGLGGSLKGVEELRTTKKRLPVDVEAPPANRR